MQLFVRLFDLVSIDVFGGQFIHQLFEVLAAFRHELHAFAPALSLELRDTFDLLICQIKILKHLTTAESSWTAMTSWTAVVSRAKSAAGRATMFAEPASKWKHMNLLNHQIW
jgi:hypothetical protein